MCRNFVVHGMCPYEQRCMFAHGDDDMRTKEMNLTDNLTTEENIKTFQRARYAAKARAAMLAAATEATEVSHPRDRPYRHDPYARWEPFFGATSRSNPRPAKLKSYATYAPQEWECAAGSCSCPACQGTSMAAPKFIPDTTRPRVLVP